LDAFLKLRSAGDRGIVRFAKEWGVLGLCGHGRPFTHNHRIDPWRQWSAPPCIPARREPLSHWHKLIGEAAAIAQTAADLIAAEPLSKLSGAARETQKEQRALGWNRVIHRAQGWLTESAASWSLFVSGPPSERGRLLAATPRSIQLTADCPMLFDVLAFQLGQAVTRSEGLYLCTACNQPFFRAWCPTQGQQVFCRECGKTARMRLYMQRKRSKSRHSERKNDDGEETQRG
jgi:hypothetical protein